MFSVVVLLLLAGCVASGTQVAQSALQGFQKGVTTRSDVIRALGPPQNTASARGKVIVSYIGVSVRPHAASFIPVVGLVAGGASSHTSVTMLTFDSDDKLEDITTHENASESHMGFAASPRVVQ